MRGAPQWFSSRMRRMSSRISPSTRGRPILRRDFQRQNTRKPFRCQRTTVSGFTIKRVDPPAPETPNDHPECAVSVGQPRTWMSSPQDLELMSKRRDFDGYVGSSAHKSAHRVQRGENKTEHRPTLSCRSSEKACHASHRDDAGSCFVEVQERRAGKGAY